MKKEFCLPSVSQNERVCYLGHGNYLPSAVEQGQRDGFDWDSRQLIWLEVVRLPEPFKFPEWNWEDIAGSGQ